MPANVRFGLYFVIDFDPNQAFYGPEATDFIAVLKRAGYAYAAAPNDQRHSWTEVRQGLGPALALVGSQQAREGVSSKGYVPTGRFDRKLDMQTRTTPPIGLCLPVQ